MRRKKGRNTNGQGCFKESKNGKIQMKKQHGFKENGKPRIFTVSGKTKAECIKKMQKKESEFDQNLITSDSLLKMTLEQFLISHLNYDIENNVTIKKTSIDRREVSIKNQISGSKIGQQQVGSISGTDIADFINGLLKSEKLSVSTVKKAFFVICGAYRWAKKRGLIKENPCDLIKDDLKKTFSILEQRNYNDVTVKTLNQSQIERIVSLSKMRNANNNKIKYPASIYTLFLKNTGMRIGEACSLRYRDIIRKDGRVLVTIYKTRHVSKNRKTNKRETFENETKNSKARIIELNDEAIKFLDIIETINPDHSDESYLIVNRSGKPTEPTKLIKRINTIYRNIGLSKDITGAHILRRTFATARYKEGKSIEEIAAYIGDLPETVRKHYINEKETLDLGNDGNINYIEKM